MTKIKPCPFCGSDAEICKFQYHVRCSDRKECDAFGPTGMDDDEAIDKWNSAPRKDSGAVDLIDETRERVDQELLPKELVKL